MLECVSSSVIADSPISSFGNSCERCPWCSPLKAFIISYTIRRFSFRSQFSLRANLLSDSHCLRQECSRVCMGCAPACASALCLSFFVSLSLTSILSFSLFSLSKLPFKHSVCTTTITYRECHHFHYVTSTLETSLNKQKIIPGHSPQFVWRKYLKFFPGRFAKVSVPLSLND